VKFSEELDLFDPAFEIVIIQQPLQDVQQVVVLDLRVRYQELIDLLYGHVLHGCLPTDHLVEVDLGLVQYQPDGGRQVDHLFGKVNSVSLLVVDLFDDFL